MSYNVIICIRLPSHDFTVVSGLRYRCKPLRHVLLDLTPCNLVKIAWMEGKSHSARSKRTSVRRENDIVVTAIYLPYVQWALSFRSKNWTPGMGNIVNKQLRTMTVDGLPNEVVAG